MRPIFETAAKPDWPRSVAQAVNGLINTVKGLTDALAALVAPNDVTGWATYFHGGGAQSIPADTIIALANDAATKDDNQKPVHVASFYDGTKILGRNGDGLALLAEFSFQPDDGAATMLEVWVDIGGAVGRLNWQRFPITGGASVATPIAYQFGVGYTRDTWEANGGTVYVRADGAGIIRGPMRDDVPNFGALRYVFDSTHKARA